MGLGLLGNREVIPTLLEMLGKAKSTGSQAAIASALGVIGDQSSLDGLTAMLQDKRLTTTARGFAASAPRHGLRAGVLPWNAKISAHVNYRASAATLTDPGGGGILNLF